MKKRKSIEDRGNRKTTVGGNWTVRFNTTGKANLTITAVNGTTWTNQPYECYDEQILTRSEINYGISQDYTKLFCKQKPLLKNISFFDQTFFFEESLCGNLWFRKIAMDFTSCKPCRDE